MTIPRYKTEIRLSSFINPLGVKRFQKINQTYPFFYDSGTSALFSFLKALDLPKDAIVGVPLYSCYSVWHSVYKAGYTIKFLDIGISPDGYIYDKNIFNELDVLIFIHYFGYINSEIDKIKMQNSSLIIIDDLTHVNLFKKPSVVSSDASIFSFNFHKPIVAGSGGILSLENSNILKTIQDEYARLDQERFFVSIKKYIRTFVKNYIYMPFVYNILYHLFIAKNKDIFLAPNLDMQIVPKKNSTLFKMLIGNQIKKYKENKELTKSYMKIPERYRLPLVGDEVLSYFPIFFDTKNKTEQNRISFDNKKLDTYMLWQNCLKTSVYYDLKSVDRYINTLKIMNNTIFLPEPLFDKKNEKILLQLIKELT